MSRYGVLLALVPGLAAAQPAPHIHPLHDVDVTYKVPVRHADDAVILQRLRWSAGLRRQRVDMPTTGSSIIVDFAAGHMQVVRDGTREVIESAAPPNALQPGAGNGYTRQGASNVAGLPCINWRSIDEHGHETLVCYSDDGVLLRVSASGRMMMEAVTVKYGPQPAEVFQAPAGYVHERAPQ